MKSFKILSIAFLAFAVGATAQDLESAKKAIDGEQYEKAKGILKGLVVTKPDFGKNYFMLGNLYLTQKIQDSAAIFFNKGLLAKNDANFNNIGLAQIELENEKPAVAKAIFDKITLSIRKKDFEENLYIGRAYMAGPKPDFKSALTYLEKAKLVQPNDAQVLLSLGDAHYGVRNNNDAFSAYRDAFDADKTAIRAKLQLARITKEAKAFPEALTQFEAVKLANPTYGPTYRELSETYYLIGLNDRKKFVESNKTALELYDKYMSLTDYSLDSRMRHADFLMLTKDYKALELEATEMKKIAKVNPRILRYLGYSAYQTGNTEAAVTALNEFLATPGAKIIGRDYMYLGLAKTRKSLISITAPDGKVTNTIDRPTFDAGVESLRKGVESDPEMANEINDIGKVFYDLKLYKEAASIYEIGANVPTSQNYTFDNFYFGYATYFEQAKAEKADVAQLQKALTAFSNVITKRPEFADAFIFKARVNGLMTTDEAAKTEMVKNYEEFNRIVTAKPAAEQAKYKTKLLESYNAIAVYYLKTDKVKVKDNLDKVLLLDPTNAEALQNIKFAK